jgi:hypothetical protein
VGVVEGLVVMDGDGLQDPVRVAVRDVEGVVVAVCEELAEADVLVEGDVVGLIDTVEDTLGLVDVVVEGEALVVLVGVGDGEGQTAHSAALGVKSSHKLNCRRPVCCRQVARRAVVVALQGPPVQVADQ